MNIPWWGGFDPRAWDVGSLFDFVVPVTVCFVFISLFDCYRDI
ncbi:hypothetical protein ACNEAM_001734 [Escherichia coli]